MRTFIHPSKGDSPYSPFSKGEWASGKKIHLSKRVNLFTLEGESPFKKDESLRSLSWKKGESSFSKAEWKKGEWNKGEWKKGESHFLRVKENIK